MSAIKTLFLLLALLCVFHPSPLCEAAVCYVKPTEPHNVTCPSQPCHTLDEYVSSSARYFVSNTVFMFLSGHHQLSHNLSVSNVHNFTFRAYKEKSSVIVDSKLTHSLSLTFESGSDIIIRDLTFQSLGTLRVLYSTNVTLTQLRAEDTDIVLYNTVGAVGISFIKGAMKCSDCACISIAWDVEVAQSQHMPNTVVLLHELELSGPGSGVNFVGCIPCNITLMNSTFSTQSDYGVRLGYPCYDMLFVCKNTLFYNNFWGLYIEIPQQNREHRMAIALHNVTYIDNVVAIILYNVQNASISDSYFEGSQSGAIQVINGRLSFMGNISFIDNYSDFTGGAISLLGESRILIPDPPNTYILFENNIVDDVGGAIYFSSSDIFVTGYCKIYLERDSNNTVFNFSMNSAANGGNAIYGAYINKSCYSPSGDLVQNLSQRILSVSSFSPSFAEDHSVISSDPDNLCYCQNGEVDNYVVPMPKHAYPGEVFRLPFAALGDMNGLVKWPVQAAVYVGSLGNELQHSQNTNDEKCTYLQYSILNREQLTILKISLQFLRGELQYRVYLHDCPLGFALSTNKGCVCSEYMSQNVNITCNITEQTIERQDTAWIGELEKNTSGLVFSAVCPFLYCKRSSIKIRINHSVILDEDIQCNDNRSGVLCGGCRDSFSLALGSNRCLHGCSNNSLFLIIAFAAAGIALVLFIKILNLTVSQGTINGLIFYANIVGVEQAVLFSSKTYGGFLSVFIAWLNLDLGIETCFFDGIDAYVKAWLQFVFPAYVWAIAILIIILSHYSLRISKLFGNNSVPVLATLILLSYSKLLRAVISALSVTDIHFLNGSTMSVWERDGNIQYLTGKHIPLFIFAVTVLLLLWVPFTLILVSIQWLQKGTYYRVLRWVIKLKPFFDAFTGPYKDKHRYWVGVLLLARCSLLLIFYIYTANGSGVTFISIIFVTLLALPIIGIVYRNYYLAVLEISYIVNLGLLTSGILYVQHVNVSGNQEILIFASVGIAFLQFMATVIYHSCVQLKKPLKMVVIKIKTVRMWDQEDAENIKHEDYEHLDGNSYSKQSLTEPPFQEIDNNFREPLLAYLDDY